MRGLILLKFEGRREEGGGCHGGKYPNEFFFAKRVGLARR